MSANPQTLPVQIPQLTSIRRVETPAQRERRAERDRARKQAKRDSRTPEQRQAAELHAFLTARASYYPGLKAEIDQFLYVLGQRSSETRDRVCDSILHMLRAGCASLDDFIDELKFSELAILSALEYFQTQGVVREVARGRSSVWELTGKQPSALPADVLP